LYGKISATTNHYSGGSGAYSSAALDRTDYSFETQANHRSELNTAGLNVSYIRDTTFDSALQQGVITTERAARDSFSASPSWTISLSELTQLTTTYEANIVRYQDNTGTFNLVNYDYQTFSGVLSHQLNSLLLGSLSVGYNLYQPDTNFDSSTISLQAGLKASINETLVGAVTVGQRLTSSDTLYPTGFCIGAIPGASFPSCTGGTAIGNGTTTGTINTNSQVYDVSLNKTLESGSLGAHMSRTSSPGGNGQLLDITQLLLNGVYRYTDNLSSALKFSYTLNDTIVNSSGQQAKETNTYYEITPSITWRWNDQWAMTGELSHARSNWATSGTADRNTLFLSLTYNPTRISVSR
jgi:hypothetical protein